MIMYIIMLSPMLCVGVPLCLALIAEMFEDKKSKAVKEYEYFLRHLARKYRGEYLPDVMTAEEEKVLTYLKKVKEA